MECIIGGWKWTYYKVLENCEYVHWLHSYCLKIFWINLVSASTVSALSLLRSIVHQELLKMKVYAAMKVVFNIEMFGYWMENEILHLCRIN
jgi:ABC-type uncharacterized transport system fused permease/ATPase subunit